LARKDYRISRLLHDAQLPLNKQQQIWGGIYIYPTRQRGTDTAHILDLVLTSENFVTEIEHLSPLGMSDHCVLQFDCQLQAIDRQY